METKRGWFFVIGCILVFLGFIAMGSAFSTSLASTLVIGWLMVCSSAVQAIHAFQMREKWSGFLLQLSTAVLSGVVGYLFLSYPFAALASLTILMAAYFLVGGVFRIVLSLSTRTPEWAWSLVGGIASVVLGLLIQMQWPVSALWVLGTFVGIELIITGCTLLSLGFVMGGTMFIPPKTRPIEKKAV